jgi:CheY-like chemotaxis protein
MNDTIETQQGPRRMLIADDDPGILRLIADRCARLGFKMETAMNGAQLLVKVHSHRPDVLIVDVKMPVLDGLSVCTHLLEPGRKPPEVIVVTGSGDPETPERCESLGLFFSRKGPDFWQGLETALLEIYPDLAVTIKALPAAAWTAAVPQRPRVLVIDGDPGIGRFFASRLGKFGVDTLHADGVMHGLRMAGKERPSVVLCSRILPDGDASVLLHRLRAAPATADLPVYVLTDGPIGDRAEQVLKRAINGRPGALSVFRKSFDTGELFAALQKFCGFEPPPRLPRRRPPHAAAHGGTRMSALAS